MLKILSLILSLLLTGIAFGDNLQNYLLPKDHPLQEKLCNFFRDEEMFNSRSSLRKNGFEVMKRVHRGLMVVKHPSIPNYLFKKFHNKIPLDEQLQNYLKRIEGARALKDFIQQNNLKYIVVPEKWLYELPRHFSEKGVKSYILIVEKMDICTGGKDPKGEVARKYYGIDKEILKEICLVLNSFRGLDSMLHNLPFTHQNQIAFIDTEKWSEKRTKIMENILPYLKRDRREYAIKFMQDLKRID